MERKKAGQVSMSSGWDGGGIGYGVRVHTIHE